MHTSRKLAVLISLMLISACGRQAYVAPESPLPANTVLLSEMMRELSSQRSSQAGYPDKLLEQLGYSPASDDSVHTEPFAAGLYGCTELFVEGMLDLFRAGILKREVDGVVLHAGFFVGSRAFYRSLREMPREIVKKFGMTSISFVNELYGDEDTKRRARINARHARRRGQR